MTWLRRWLRNLGSALDSGLCAAGSAWADSACLGYGFPLAVSYPFEYRFPLDPRTGQPIRPGEEPLTDARLSRG